MYISVQEASKLIGFSRMSVYKNIEKGVLRTDPDSKTMKVNLEDCYRIRKEREKMTIAAEKENMVKQAQEQLTEVDMKKHLAKLIEESPSRQRNRFIPDYSLTEEYKAMKNIDTSKMSSAELNEHARKLTAFKRQGTYAEEVRLAEIDRVLGLPISEVIGLRDTVLVEIEKLEAEIDNFDISDAQNEADKLYAQYSQRARGGNPMYVATLQSECDKKVEDLEFKMITVPKNDLKVKRAEAVEKYKIYNSRIHQYCDINRDAINRQIEKAREAEIEENLAVLAEYMEG